MFFFFLLFSSEARIIVVNVEYRLAPEYKYPACVQDAMCATTWVLKNKIKIGKQVLIIGVPYLHYV